MSSWSAKVKVELSDMAKHRVQPLLDTRLASIYEDHLDCHLYHSHLRLIALWKREARNQRSARKVTMCTAPCNGCRDAVHTVKVTVQLEYSESNRQMLDN
jgi:hypothetical protein